MGPEFLEIPASGSINIESNVIELNDDIGVSVYGNLAPGLDVNVNIMNNTIRQNGSGASFFPGGVNLSGDFSEANVFGNRITDNLKGVAPDELA